ncbi:MAG: RdgB/HAM1 family non-canonical purine NTP pyrophosphatase [Oscillospiraceae bacterium]|nr:RdgB/HAM1 family non-canonical purine NTP pyrophosphatase [Oscillospiraceae bacterium]
MNTTLIAATNNPAKLKEMRRILGELGIEVVTMAEAGLDLHPREDGLTFAENARKKAEAVCSASGRPAIADDSGLCIDALGGSPGIYSARYGGEELDDAARTELILGLMKDIPPERRSARFRCAVCVAYPDGRRVEAEGLCEGRVLDRACGHGGFGYDPIFEDSNGYRFGVVGADVKDSVSHRHHALTALAAKLKGEDPKC